MNSANKPNSRKRFKVILDTNAINNRSIGNGLFGNRKFLKDVIDIIDVVIPAIVIDEIKEHKRKAFNNAKDIITKSGLQQYINGLDSECLDKIAADKIIEDDIKSESIPYSIIEVGNSDLFLEKFIPLVIKNKPPFGVDTDKGIKDAIIAASIEKLLEDIEDKVIILITGDARLKEYFAENNRVKVIADPNQLKETLEKDKGIVEQTSKGQSIKFIGISEEGKKRAKVAKMLTNFRNSQSFRNTHSFIEQLRKSIDELNIQDKRDIIDSSINNPQIRWIINDPDICSFLVGIYHDCKYILSDSIRNDFEALVDIGKIDEMEEIADIFSDISM